MDRVLETKLKMYDRSINSGRGTDNTYYLRAGIHFAAGRFEDALADYDMAVRKAIELGGTSDAKHIYYLDKAKTLIKLGRYQEAFDLVSSIDPALFTSEPKDTIDLYARDALRDILNIRQINDMMEAAAGRGELSHAMQEISEIISASLLRFQEGFREGEEENEHKAEYRSIINGFRRDNVLHHPEEFRALLNRLSELEKKTKGLEDKVSTIELALRAVERQIDQNKEQIDDIINKYAALKKNSEVSNRDIANLISENSELFGMIEGIFEDIDRLQLDSDLIRELKNGLETQGVSIEQIRLDIESLKTQVEDIHNIVLSIESDLKAFEDKVSKMSGYEEVVSIGERLKVVEGKVGDQTEIVCYMSKVLTEANVYDKQRVIEGFKKLEQEDLDLYNYAQKFYWTLSNYCLAYRVIGTGMVSGGDSEKSHTKYTDKVLDAIVGAFANMISDTAGSVPFVGGVIKFVEESIGGIYGEYKKLKFERKVEKINEIISKHITEEDLNLEIAETAIQLARSRKDIIKAQHLEQDGRMEKAKKWLDSKMDKLLEKATNIKMQYSDPVSKLALEDVTMLLGSVYTTDTTGTSASNSSKSRDANSISNSSNNDNNNASSSGATTSSMKCLSIDVEALFASGGAIDQALLSAHEHKDATKPWYKVFMVDGITYDNPALNHQSFMKEGAKLVGSMNEFLDLTIRADRGLLDRAIEESNPSVLLAGNTYLYEE